MTDSSTKLHESSTFFTTEASRSRGMPFVVKVYSWFLTFYTFWTTLCRTIFQHRSQRKSSYHEKHPAGAGLTLELAGHETSTFLTTESHRVKTSISELLREYPP